jgi:glyoxylase-like metal-dependent hydrolase (beta-lactamase superfamily II)
MLEFRIIPVTPFQQNCTLIWCAETRKAAIIDPGGEPARIQAAIAETGVTPEQILLTHGHIDHVGAAGLLAERLGVPTIGPHRDDAFLLESLPAQSVMFGFPPVEAFATESWLADGDQVALGNSMLEVLHCPGHTPGHVVFYSTADRLAQVGDVIFQGSVGRSDFPGGDQGQLIHSIRSRLFPLGDDIRFIPGHGPMSTIGAERRTNPFVGDRAR